MKALYIQGAFVMQKCSMLSTRDIHYGVSAN